MFSKGIPIEYLVSVNKALQFIEVNLDQDLTLEEVSAIACYSPFHFHRIFKTTTNETLNSYISRKRIEKAASILLHKHELSITEISSQHGFNSNSSFTRSFKKFYNLSPSAFRQQGPAQFSKIGEIESKIGQVYKNLEAYFCDMNNLKNWIEMNAKIEIKEMPELKLAYVTSLGHKGIAAAYDVLVKWAKPNGILELADTKMVTIYHDSFKITSPEKVRLSACVTLNTPISASGEVGLTTIQKGRCIVASAELELKDFGNAWKGLFVWMAENGYKKADRNPYEIYHNDYRTHPHQKSIVDFCIPIE